VPGSGPEATPELVVVGRIGAAHGVRGGVRVTSATQPPENILNYRPWLLKLAGGVREVSVASVRAHGDAFVAFFDGVPDREAAEGLKGAEIAVPRSALPALEAGQEYYWQDLIGLEVVDRRRGRLGTVSELIETGANDVLVVGDGGGRPVLIPFVGAVVTAVNLEAGRIEVDWQEPA